jgi:hypothetical protein
LVKTVKELEIELASDEEGCMAQITAIKPGELLRAEIAEASYQAYLHNLKLKDGPRDDEVYLKIIDNKHRGFSSTSNSNLEVGSKEKRNQKGVKKKKKWSSCFEHEGFWEASQEETS